MMDRTEMQKAVWRLLGTKFLDGFCNSLYKAILIVKTHIGLAGSVEPLQFSPAKPEGGDIAEFREEHAGTNPEKRSAYAACHTALPSDINSSEFPHQFEWQKR